MKIFYEKSQILQVPRVPVPFKIWSFSTLQHVILCSIKDYQNRFKIYLSSMWNQLQDSTPHLSSYRSSYNHSSQYFFEVLPMRVFSPCLPSSVWSYTCWSMTCCFQSLSRHGIQTGVSELKIISLYIVMVSLMASLSSSFVFMQFWRCIFNFFCKVLTVMLC